MTDGLDTGGFGRRQEDWDTGNRDGWEFRAQERAQVLSHSRRRTQSKERRVADLELELAEVKQALAMLSKFVMQSESARRSSSTVVVGSPLDALLASLGDAPDEELPNVEFSEDMIASLLADE